MTITARWVAFCQATPYDALPPDVLERAKMATLDFLGVALAGVTMPMAAICAQYLRDLGGRSQATVIGSRARIPAIHAALVNGVLGHALDLDDGHRLAAGHPGVVTLPAALAAAELYQVSGRAFLRAVVLGYETFVRLAAAVNPAHLERGFHTTSTVGPFAAATAAGLLGGLDQDRLTAALGLAGLQGAGLMQVVHEAAMAKPFQAGRASAAGLLAVQLAERGAAGPPAILEGAHGFLQAMGGDPTADPLTTLPGEDWQIRGTYFKEHAACRHTHAAIDAAASLRQTHGLRPEEIEQVIVRTYSVADRLCGRHDLPRDPSEAKFHLPFAVALGLTIGHARASCFTPVLVADEGLRALARRVRVEVDPALEARYPAQRPAVLEVATFDGRRLRVEMPVARGEPELPLSSEDLEAKFVDNARASLPVARAQAVVTFVSALEHQPSCAPLLGLLASRRAADRTAGRGPRRARGGAGAQPGKAADVCTI